MENAEGWRALPKHRPGLIHPASPGSSYPAGLKNGAWESARRDDFELPGSALFADPRKGRFKP
jgi:hypothetical protein